MVKTKLKYQGHKLTLWNEGIGTRGGRGGEVVFSGKDRNRLSRDKSPKVVTADIEYMHYGSGTKARVPFLRKIYKVEKA